MAINHVTIQIRFKNMGTVVAVGRIAFLLRFVIGAKLASRVALWSAKKIARYETVFPART